MHGYQLNSTNLDDIIAAAGTYPLINASAAFLEGDGTWQIACLACTCKTLHALLGLSPISIRSRYQQLFRLHC